MNLRPIHFCEICGARRDKQATWFLASQECVGSSLSILFWNDAVASRDDVWAFCSAEHVQQFIRDWVASDIAPGFVFPGPVAALARPQGPFQNALRAQIHIHPAALNCGFARDRESALSMLDALEAVLETYDPEAELYPEGTFVFDA
jgi:hypothetical protein